MKTIKLDDKAFEILALLKWSTKSNTYSETILKMDETIRTFAPIDANTNRNGLFKK